MNEKNRIRANEIYALLYLGLALFLLLALISYHPADPSFNRYDTGTAQVHNFIGAFGSHTADILLGLLGLSAFCLPPLFFVLSCRYFRQTPFGLQPAGVASCLAFLVSLAGLCALALGELVVYDRSFQAGGLTGDILAQFLNGYFNQIGTYLLLTLMAAISLTFMFDLSLSELAKKLGCRLLAAARRLREAVAAYREAGEEKQVLRERKKKPAPVIGESTWAKEEHPPTQQELPLAPRPRECAFTLPPLTLLDQAERKDTKVRKEPLIAIARLLEKKLSDFGVEGKVTEIRPGPVITMYELEPAPGVKINKITNLSDDLALALKAPSVRIIAPIPGKAAVGIEIPQQEREPVHLKDVIDNETFRNSTFKLPMALGVDITGVPVVADLIRMPHLLIAGTTGSGKSVALNAMICSILFKAPPQEVKFLMIDPKRLEFSSYEGIPHLLHPVVLDPKMAAQVLKWAVEEMERRYKIISALGVKNIETYNQTVAKLQAGEGKGKRLRKSGEEEPGTPGTETAPPVQLPYIIIVIDELADLMLVAQRNVEESLARLAQMARAAGIHLILATQRPSVDVITGVIKANFPTRISFQVSSKVDSRTILDQHGAEKLLGAGDMLFIPPGTSKITRIHGAYVSDKEIERIVDFVTQQAKPAYDESILKFEAALPEEEKKDSEFDEKYDEAVELVTELGHASVSLVQRYLKIGYNRAARIVERMEAEGVVGPSDGVKPRKVLARRIPS